MNRRIRQLGIGMLVLYVLLFGQLNRVQFVKAQDLREDPLNVRPLLREFGRARGQILSADGVLLAHSVATTPDSDIDFVREYPTAERYAHIVGFQSFNQGAFGLERSFNDELAGERFEQQFQSPADLFRDRDSTGTLVLTLATMCSRQRRLRWVDVAGRWSLSNPPQVRSWPCGPTRVSIRIR